MIVLTFPLRFGLDSTGLKEANKLHNVLGPILMVGFSFLPRLSSRREADLGLHRAHTECLQVIYSCLSSTLLLTVLVSILSNTFNQINRDAIAEQMYRRAVSTFQGVKSDGIFSFQPPINILALIFLWPARFMVTPHFYHKIIVFAARLSNAPLLLLIHFIELHFLFNNDNNNDGRNGNGNRIGGGTTGRMSDWLKPSTYFQHLDLFGGARTELNAVFEFEEDIDDDALPGGAFDIHDGVMTPAIGVGHDDTRIGESGGGNNGRSMQLGHGEMDERTGRSTTTTTTSNNTKGQDTLRAARERSRQRRTQSMSDWGGTIASSSSTPRARPTILSKLYGYGSSRSNVNYRERSTLVDALSASLPPSHSATRTPTTANTPTTGSSRLSSLWLDNGDNGDNDVADEADEEREEENRLIRERLERIEEGQKRIEEALKALGGGD